MLASADFYTEKTDDPMRMDEVTKAERFERKE